MSHEEKEAVVICGLEILDKNNGGGWVSRETLERQTGIGKNVLTTILYGLITVGKVSQSLPDRRIRINHGANVMARWLKGDIGYRPVIVVQQ